MWAVFVFVWFSAREVSANYAGLSMKFRFFVVRRFSLISRDPQLWISRFFWFLVCIITDKLLQTQILANRPNSCDFLKISVSSIFAFFAKTSAFPRVSVCDPRKHAWFVPGSSEISVAISSQFFEIRPNPFFAFFRPFMARASGAPCEKQRTGWVYDTMQLFGENFLKLFFAPPWAFSPLFAPISSALVSHSFFAIFAAESIVSTAPMFMIWNVRFDAISSRNPISSFAFSEGVLFRDFAGRLWCSQLVNLTLTRWVCDFLS